MFSDPGRLLEIVLVFDLHDLDGRNAVEERARVDADS